MIFSMYVDDVRATGHTHEACWNCTRKVASSFNNVGIQDAARKRRGPSLEPGAWAGSIIYASDGVVTVTVSVERWLKAKGMIQWIHECIEAELALNHKQLESHRGFLVYISCTYPSLVPYLKGIHLTLDSWRPNRDADGWKIPSKDLDAALDMRGWAPTNDDSHHAPSSVSPVPQLQMDVYALMELFKPDVPPNRPVRPSATAVALYGFGDASGSGFGTTILIQGSIHYRHGQWSTNYSEHSSNYRELSNLVLGIEEAYTSGLLDNCELFLFTDNTTAEAAFHKGTSSSKPLFELVLRLRVLQMHGTLFIHVIHVAGKRMQSQGTDGLSRGSLASGVLSGDDMLSFIPLHQSALDRQPSLTGWVHSWFSALPYSWLTPFEWFTTGRGSGQFVWCPPPAAAEVALENLATAIHIRPSSQHIVLIPRLMTACWRKLLGKLCDLIFQVPLGSDVWPHHHFEPLLVGIYFPLSRHRPWRLRDTPLLASMAVQLSSLSSDDFNWGGDILRQLLCQAWSLDSLSPSMARKLLLRN
jgi:hypothetical protein